MEAQMTNNNFNITRRDFLKLSGTSLITLGLMTSCTQKQFETIILWMVELSEEINNYRKQNGLAAIPISDDLTAVALKHCMDLNTYHPEQSCGDGGNLHSWSNNGNWAGTNGDGAFKGCCYPDDHSKTKCMWDKPKEITNYPDNGFEIAHWSSSTVSAHSALNSWKTSTLGHNDVILEKGWGPWKALGAVYMGNYACAWFGKV
jgi:hypothetical protein